jgi:hypothetical protein
MRIASRRRGTGLVRLVPHGQARDGRSRTHERGPGLGTPVTPPAEVTEAAMDKLWIPLVTLLVIAVVGGIFLVIGGIEGDDADTGPDQQPTRSATE